MTALDVFLRLTKLRWQTRRLFIGYSVRVWWPWGCPKRARRGRRRWCPRPDDTLEATSRDGSTFPAAVRPLSGGWSPLHRPVPLGCLWIPLLDPSLALPPEGRGVPIEDARSAPRGGRGRRFPGSVAPPGGGARAVSPTMAWISALALSANPPTCRVCPLAPRREPLRLAAVLPDMRQPAALISSAAALADLAAKLGAAPLRRDSRPSWPRLL